MSDAVAIRAAIMKYAEAVRVQRSAERAAQRHTDAAVAARERRQELWREVKRLSPIRGVYRVASSGQHEEGLLIGDGDYPEVFSMYDAHEKS